MFPLPEVWPNAILHAFLCLVIGLVLSRWFMLRPGGSRAAMAMLLFIFAGLGVGVVTSPSLPGSAEFALMLASCWTLGLAVPAFGVALTAQLVQQRRRAAWGMGVFTGLVALATLDAFVLEPRSFEVQRVTLPAPRLDAPLRIALIADLQTDHPGPYERRVLEAVRAEGPDLVLYAGDLIQAYDDERYAIAWEDLRAILQEVSLRPPLGTYVVNGDSEWRPSWVHELRGTGLQLLTPPTDTVVVRDDLELTGLPLGRSKGPIDLARPSARYHIVLGHRPDFALGSVDADLLLAGHTHGGQVQIPGFGPLMTLSNIPRAWAAGTVVALDDDTTLVVSRGLGMERGVAPRLRFMCRPEIVILDLLPTGS